MSTPELTDEDVCACGKRRDRHAASEAFHPASTCPCAPCADRRMGGPVMVGHDIDERRQREQRQTETALREALQAAMDAGATVIREHEHAQGCWGGGLSGPERLRCTCGLLDLHRAAAQSRRARRRAEGGDVNLAADKCQKALREHDDLRWAVAVLAERLRVSEGLRHLCREARMRCPRCVERMHGNLVRALKGVKPASARAMKADALRAANEKRQDERLARIVKSCKGALGVVPRSP